MKQMDGDNLRRLFKIFNIRLKEACSDLSLSYKSIDGIINQQRPHVHYEDLFKAYFSAKRAERIKTLERLIEYYKSVEI